MARQFVGRISFPHPLGESPGSYLLFESTLPAEKQAQLRQLKEKEFGGLEYRCTNIKCRKPVGISKFNCNKCGGGLEIKVDVVEQDGQKKIVPATARAWCNNNHKFTYGKKFHGKCKDDNADLEYCLIGNERTEFALWMCLAISSREAGKTTPYYEASLSTRSVGKVLDVLAAAGLLERKTLDVVLGNYAKEPEYFVLTEKGAKEREEYLRKIKSYGLLNNFRAFMSKREEELRSVPESDEERHRRYLSVVKPMKVQDLPESIRKPIADEGNGVKAPLIKYITDDMLRDDEEAWLEATWSEQISDSIAVKRGFIFEFSVVMKRRDAKQFTIEHIPTLYQKEIFLRDNARVWGEHART